MAAENAQSSIFRELGGRRRVDAGEDSGSLTVVLAFRPAGRHAKQGAERPV